jgi:hypothetical protein
MTPPLDAPEFRPMPRVEPFTEEDITYFTKIAVRLIGACLIAACIMGAVVSL